MLIFWGKNVLSAKVSRLSTSCRQRHFCVVNENCWICILEIHSKHGYGALSLLLSPTSCRNCLSLTRWIYDLWVTSSDSLSFSDILSYCCEHVGPAYRWWFRLMTMQRLPLLCVACKGDGDRLVGSWAATKMPTRNAICRFSFWKH